MICEIRIVSRFSGIFLYLIAPGCWNANTQYALLLGAEVQGLLKTKVGAEMEIKSSGSQNYTIPPYALVIGVKTTWSINI